MMIVQYLLDSDRDGDDSGRRRRRRPSSGTSSSRSRLALEQERRVTEQISDLTQLARDERELVGEQFLHWFLQEQREEVS